MNQEARFRFIAALLVIPLLAFVVPQARALDATVNCPNGDGGTYPSINAALVDVGARIYLTPQAIYAMIRSWQALLRR